MVSETESARVCDWLDAAVADGAAHPDRWNPDGRNPLRRRS